MTQTYCWRAGNDPDGAWQIGRYAEVFHEFHSCMQNWFLGERVMIRHYHTGELELIPLAWLKPYPSEPIPNP